MIEPEKFKRIVVANRDPNPLINKGLQTLIDKGLRVDFNVCEDDAKFVNRRFFTFYEKKRPFVILKFAIFYIMSGNNIKLFILCKK